MLLAAASLFSGKILLEPHARPFPILGNENNPPLSKSTFERGLNSRKDSSAQLKACDSAFTDFCGVGQLLLINA